LAASGIKVSRIGSYKQAHYISWLKIAMRRLSPLIFLLPSIVSCAEQSPSASYTAAPADATTTLVSNVASQVLTEEGAAKQPTAGRHVIYRASIALHVKDFAEADRKIVALVNSAGGYLAQYREDRPHGAQRGGHWTVRVPVSQFTSFLEAVGQLGVAEQREVQSQDVTEEFVDLNSRQKNKQALESRLLELVANRGDDIKDVLALEAELSRVREEIEKIQGKLRFLTDRIALTTMDISAYERLDYRPPEATFAGRIAATFLISLDRLRQLLEAAAVALTAVAPWAFALAVIVSPFAIFFRNRRRRSRATPIQATTA
jgi:uncharacterized coiled-coil protein SlyX